MRIPTNEWVPDWARQAIFYHIYPLGFLDAPANNDLQSEPEPRLEALREWYDHIAGLGVNAVYFGPLFESLSHGYDTVDYFHIDRRLGTNDLFKQIVEEFHQRHIKVIIDGVFNHTSREFFAFKDLQEKGRDSDYKDWYHINWGADSAYGDGFSYHAWEGHQQLPELNLSNDDVRHYLLEVSRMWLGDMGVDGWRLDVAHEIDPDFWWVFRRASKAANPDAFLMGELMHGDYRTWVAPDLLDSGTDYQLYNALWRSFNDINFHDVQTLLDRAYHVEWGLFNDLVLYNFLSNHDVSRIMTQLDNPQHVFPALILLMTLPGIPGIYYGDETGMRGDKDHGDAALRAPMLPPDGDWPDRQKALYREIGRLAAIRKANPALIYGRYASLEVSPTTFAFLRQHVRQTIIVAINVADDTVPVTINAGKEGVPNGTVFYDVLNSESVGFTVENGQLHIEKLWPCWGRVLLAVG